MRPGVTELLIIFLGIIVLFGYKRLPDIARSIGRAIREFRRADADDSDKPPSSGDGASSP